MITFVLAGFSTVTTVLPFLTSSDNQSPDIYRFQALVTLGSLNTQFADSLWADNILHRLTIGNTQSDQGKTSSDPEVLLALAALNYNNNSITNAKYFDQKAQKLCESKWDCLQTQNLTNGGWYIYRLLNLDSPSKNIVHEDTKCIKTQYTCTQQELAWIKNNVSSLSTHGYAFQFYNDRDPVNFLQKSIDTFIADLHTFIIISLVTGPIIFIFAVRTYPSSKNKERRNSKNKKKEDQGAE